MLKLVKRLELQNNILSVGAFMINMFPFIKFMKQNNNPFLAFFYGNSRIFHLFLEGNQPSPAETAKAVSALIQRIPSLLLILVI